MVKRVLHMVGRFILSLEIRFAYLAKLGWFDKWSDEKFKKELDLI